MVKLSSVIDAAIVLVLLIGLSIYFPILPTGLLALSSLLTVIFIVSAAKGGLIPGPKGHIVMALVAAIVGVVFLVLGITQLMPWLYAAPAAGAGAARAGTNGGGPTGAVDGIDGWDSLSRGEDPTD